MRQSWIKKPTAIHSHQQEYQAAVSAATIQDIAVNIANRTQITGTTQQCQLNMGTNGMDRQKNQHRLRKLRDAAASNNKQEEFCSSAIVLWRWFYSIKILLKKTLIMWFNELSFDETKKVKFLNIWPEKGNFSD